MTRKGRQEAAGRNRPQKEVGQRPRDEWFTDNGGEQAIPGSVVRNR